MVFLGLLGDPDLYYSAQHRTYSNFLLIFRSILYIWVFSMVTFRTCPKKIISKKPFTITLDSSNFLDVFWYIFSNKNVLRLSATFEFYHKLIIYIE